MKQQRLLQTRNYTHVASDCGLGSSILGVAEDAFDEGGLGARVGVAVGGEGSGGGALERGVGAGFGGIGAQMIAEEDVAASGRSVGRADIEMVRRRSGRREECLAAGDAEIALVRVAERGEALDGDGYVEGGAHENVHIDDGLCHEARHRGAADVFDGDGQAAESGRDRVLQFFEDLRPAGIVIGEDDGSSVISLLAFSILPVNSRGNIIHNNLLSGGGQLLTRKLD